MTALGHTPGHLSLKRETDRLVTPSSIGPEHPPIRNGVTFQDIVSDIYKSAPGVDLVQIAFPTKALGLYYVSR
ncbi:unnamed protein product [Callosobruchus maculatus]|uniref:Uncharacterized protein n=1 Tax=Callosobruchus maculatus TaxID=64391 RepID=A0A653BUP9_CALMS|nr:unnamed protein product [Callosobruchus maculatus]